MGLGCGMQSEFATRGSGRGPWLEMLSWPSALFLFWVLVLIVLAFLVLADDELH